MSERRPSSTAAVLDGLVFVAAVLMLVAAVGGFGFAIGECSVSVRDGTNPLVVALIVLSVRIALYGNPPWLGRLLPFVRRRAGSLSVGRVLVLSAVLFAMHALYTTGNYLRIAFMDQLDFLEILPRMLDGEYDFTFRFGRHGDHWHTSAYLLMALLARFSGWDLFWEAGLSLGFFGLTWVLLAKTAIETDRRAGSKRTAVSLLLMALLYFSFGQMRNLLWTWQLSAFLNVFGASLAIYSLSRVERSPWLMGPALFGAVVACHSFSNGFLLWPIGLLLLSVSSLAPPRRYAFFFLWSAVAAGVIGHFFLTGFTPSSGTELSLDSMSRYATLYLGAPLAASSRYVAVVIGAAGLGLAVVLTRALARRDRRSLRLLAPYYALLLYGLGSAALTSLGRHHMTVSQGLAWKYFTFSEFFWIGLIGLGAHACSAAREEGAPESSAAPATGLVTGALIVLVALAFTTGIDVARTSAARSARINATIPIILSTYPDVPVRVMKAHIREGPLLRRHFRVMYENRLNVFRDAEP